MDANEDIRVCMEEAKSELGLVDAVLSKHNSSPPATHNKNDSHTPIDGIWVSALLSIRGSMYRAFNEGVLSDHRAIWVNIPY